MARVLTRSEGQEIHCIAIEPDGEYVRVLRLILDWSVPLEGSRYVVNGERWRPVNPANRWEGESQSFDEAVAYYKCKDPWPDDPPASSPWKYGCCPELMTRPTSCYTRDPSPRRRDPVLFLCPKPALISHF